MRRIFSIGISSLFAALLVVGCQALQSGAPPVTPAMVRIGAIGGMSAATLAAGRELLATRCTVCHSLEPVAKYSPAQWQTNVQRMSGRTKLNEEETRQITAYLVAARESL